MTLEVWVAHTGYGREDDDDPFPLWEECLEEVSVGLTPMAVIDALDALRETHCGCTVPHRRIRLGTVHRYAWYTWCNPGAHWTARNPRKITRVSCIKVLGT